MARRTRNVETTRQPVDTRVSAAIHAICDESHADFLTDDGRIKILCKDTLIHSIREDGRILHNPNYPDPFCPCHFQNEDDSDTSATADAMTAYTQDFFSLSLAENAGVANTSGTWLERRVAESIYRQQERGAA